MFFGPNHKTGVERIAESIIKNNQLDTSPSKKTLTGSDSAVLNLRAQDPHRVLGRPGRFRHGPQSSRQSLIDRLSRQVPTQLSRDLSLDHLVKEQACEGRKNIPGQRYAAQLSSVKRKAEDSESKKTDRKSFVPH